VSSRRGFIGRLLGAIVAAPVVAKAVESVEPPVRYINLGPDAIPSCSHVHVHFHREGEPQNVGFRERDGNFPYPKDRTIIRCDKVECCTVCVFMRSNMMTNMMTRMYRRDTDRGLV